MYGTSKEDVPALDATSRLHHPVFTKFSPWRGHVPSDFIVNFLGVLTRTSYFAPYAEISRAYPADRLVAADYPQFDEEYFEWIDLLEAVAGAVGHFTMIELGAGFGRWTANAAAALRSLGNLPHTFVAVEAEPTHFAWLIEHLTDNRVDPANLQLVQAAVAGSDGTVGFHLEHNQLNGPGEWYGQYIGGPHSVAAVSLRSLLQSLSTVDLIDIDIQGAELQVLAAAAEQLDLKVKRIHIGTHGHDIEAGLHSLFARLGWHCSHSFPCSGPAATEWGTIVFQDGVQSWLNPSFSDSQKDPSEILSAKLAASRNEGARLWQELEQQRREHERLLTVSPDSLPGKLLLRAGQLRNRLAPPASRRRKLVDSILRKESS
jgi:FkbM family methyltransferase